MSFQKNALPNTEGQTGNPPEGRFPFADNAQDAQVFM
jgi:hypothetical protein